MLECLTQDLGAAGSSLTGVTALWSLSKTHPSIVLVQPRKTHPCLTERLLMGHKESNQTKQFEILCLNGDDMVIFRNIFLVFQLRFADHDKLGKMFKSIKNQRFRIELMIIGDHYL